MRFMDLGKDTYLVDGKVIKADVPGMFDPSRQEDRDELGYIAGSLFASRFEPACYGALTACCLRPAGPDCGDAKYEEDQIHFSELHDGARRILRREFPDHAEGI